MDNNEFHRYMQLSEELKFIKFRKNLASIKIHPNHQLSSPIDEKFEVHDAAIAKNKYLFQIFLFRVV